MVIDLSALICLGVGIDDESKGHFLGIDPSIVLDSFLFSGGPGSISTPHGHDRSEQGRLIP